MVTIGIYVWGLRVRIYDSVKVINWNINTTFYLKVSQAATKTRYLFSTSQKQILARFVLLPTPLTPQKVMTYGLPFDFVSRTSRIMSTRRFGVKSSISDVFIISFTVP